MYENLCFWSNNALTENNKGYLWCHTRSGPEIIKITLNLLKHVIHNYHNKIIEAMTVDNDICLDNIL